MNQKPEFAAWWKVAKNGSHYLSVSCTCTCGAKNNGNMFENTFKKEGEKTPDFRTLKDKPAQTQQGQEMREEDVPF